MADVIRQRRINDRQISVIPNWADGKAICPLPVEVNSLRVQWGLTGKFIAGYSGNLGRGHEFATILDAAEILRNDSTIAFVIIGGGYGYDRMRMEVERRGLRNVFFKPYQIREQLGSSLTLPDVHLISLLPTLEGLIFPSKYYGAAAAGRPVAFIGSTSGELANEIAICKCGMAFQPTDATGLAKFLVELRDNTPLRNRMGAHIRSRFDDRYDKVHGLSKWKGLIEAAQFGRRSKTKGE
jgi:glycosyltransferase involved in cell wall biosynthesis